MPCARPLLPLVLLCACATSGAASEETTPPPSAAPATVDADAAASGTASLDSDLVGVASTAGKVEKLLLRAAKDGRLIKQSVYHDDASAIPEPVRALAKSKFPKATVTGYETEQYADRGRVYEVEVDDGGTPCEVAALEDGTEVYTECEIDPATLSAAARATIDKIAPGAKILEAETKKGPGIDELSVEVRAGDRELYIRLGPDGALIEAMRRIPAVVEVPLP